jgi:tetratricopeptide (TPR) repeat protein
VLFNFLDQNSSMSENQLFESKKITTLSQARLALSRERGSFEEWLECTEVFAKTRNWSELETAAARALEAASNRPIKPPLLRQAAMRFAAGSLRNFTTKSQFEQSCKATSLSLRDYARLFPYTKNELKTYLDSTIETLDEIALLLTDSTSPAMVSIASKLRTKIGRPDLAAQVATVAINLESTQMAAYVTRGSAFVELEDYQRAYQDFIIAENDRHSRKYAVAGHTKMLICQANYSDALELGSELLRLPKSRPILYLLAAAAKGAGDSSKFDWLVKEAEKLPDVKQGSGRKLLIRQSIEILISHNQFDVAKALLDELKSFDRGKKVNALQESLIHAEAVYLSIINPG